MKYGIDTADAVTWLKGLPASSVDCCITDPPYSSLEKHRAVGTTTRLTTDWFPVVPNSYFGVWFQELYRVLRDNTHCYVICDQETMFAIKPMGEAAGFRFWKPLVWDKGTIGMGYHYRARHEFILFFEKGKRNLNTGLFPDVLAVPKISASRRIYPTEKPVDLLRILVGESTAPGDVVMDPFFGSASTGLAACSEGRDFIGADIETRAMELVADRFTRDGHVLADTRDIVLSRRRRTVVIEGGLFT